MEDSFKSNYDFISNTSNSNIYCQNNILFSKNLLCSANCSIFDYQEVRTNDKISNLRTTPISSANCCSTPDNLEFKNTSKMCCSFKGEAFESRTISSANCCSTPENLEFKNTSKMCCSYNIKNTYNIQLEIWLTDIFEEFNKYRSNRCKEENYLFSKNNIYFIKICNYTYCNKLHYAGHPQILPYKNSSEYETNNLSYLKRKKYIYSLPICKDHINLLLSYVKELKFNNNINKDNYRLENRIMLNNKKINELLTNELLNFTDNDNLNELYKIIELFQEKILDLPINILNNISNLLSNKINKNKEFKNFSLESCSVGNIVSNSRTIGSANSCSFKGEAFESRTRDFISSCSVGNIVSNSRTIGSANSCSTPENLEFKNLPLVSCSQIYKKRNFQLNFIEID
jgi:hypothetical protein